MSLSPPCISTGVLKNGVVLLEALNKFPFGMGGLKLTKRVELGTYKIGVKLASFHQTCISAQPRSGYLLAFHRGPPNTALVIFP